MSSLDGVGDDFASLKSHSSSWAADNTAVTIRKRQSHLAASNSITYTHLASICAPDPLPPFRIDSCQPAANPKASGLYTANLLINSEAPEHPVPSCIHQFQSHWTSPFPSHPLPVTPKHWGRSEPGGKVRRKAEAAGRRRRTGLKRLSKTLEMQFSVASCKLYGWPMHPPPSELGELFRSLPQLVPRQRKYVFLNCKN